MTLIDVTLPIDKNTIIFSGDPKFKLLQVKNIKDDGYMLYELSMGNHTGTHIDFPAHVFIDGNNADHYNLDFFSNEGVILDCSNVNQNQEYIDKDFLIDQIKKQHIKIQKNDIFFLKYGQKLKKINCLPPLTLEAVSILLDSGIKIIGTESLSIDHLSSLDLPIHKKILANDTLIVEGLAMDAIDMNKITSGRVNIFIFPIRFSALDGVPCRVGINYI